MPDESANGLFEYAQRKGYDWGTIGTIPEIPGLAVRYNGHVGVYIGNGKVVEERGFNYGCVITNLQDRKWTHWYKIPALKYVTGSSESAIKTELGSRLLKKGSVGDDVKQLQVLLNQVLNLDLATDGQYGNNTVNAVIKFQNRYKLTSDGIYGSQTHAALMSVLADRTPDTDSKTPSEPTSETYAVNASTLNVRAGNDTSYNIITTLHNGDIINPVIGLDGKPLVSKNNWYAIYILEQIGWISGKYVMMK